MPIVDLVDWWLRVIDKDTRGESEDRCRQDSFAFRLGRDLGALHLQKQGGKQGREKQGLAEIQMGLRDRADGGGGDEPIAHCEEAGSGAIPAEVEQPSSLRNSSVHCRQSALRRSNHLANIATRSAKYCQAQIL